MTGGTSDKTCSRATDRVSLRLTHGTVDALSVLTFSDVQNSIIKIVFYFENTK